MRIAIDVRELEGRPTGVGRYLSTLLRSWLSSSGTEEFILFHREPPRAEWLDHPRVYPCRLPVGVPAVDAYWQRFALGRGLRRERPDVLFAPSESMPRSYTGPVLLTVHDLSYFAHPEWFGRMHGERRRAWVSQAVARATRIVAVSRFTQQELVDRLGVDPGKIEVIHHGIDDALQRIRPTEESELRRRIGFDGPFALAVGSVFERRFPLELIEAFSLLTDCSIGLVIVGEDRRLDPQPALEACIEELGLAGRVRWLRYCSDADLAGLYRTAHHSIYLSSYEGFGLPPLEGMRFGLPAVVSKGHAFDEIYSAAALMVEQHTASSIAATVRRMVSEPALRDELIARGKALTADLTVERCAQKHLELLRAM